MDDQRHMPEPQSPSTKDEEDWNLIRGIGLGDQEAFEKLYVRYYDYLLRFVYRVTRRLDFIEDIINETMLVVWQKAEAVKPVSRASTWILGIAYKKILKSLRQHQPSLRQQSLDLSDLPGDENTMINRLETENLIKVALASLPPDQRAVMELTYYHEMHYRDVATVMGCPENTVKTRMFHARKKLRAVLPALAGECDHDRNRDKSR